MLRLCLPVSPASLPTSRQMHASSQAPSRHAKGFRGGLLLCVALLPSVLASVPAVKPTAGGAASAQVQGARCPSDARSLEAYWEAGVCFTNGERTELARGRALLREAALLGLPAAQQFLGACLSNGWHGFEVNAGGAADWFRVAAEAGNAYAQLDLAQCLFSGTGVSRNQAEAEKLLRKAIAAGADYTWPEPPAGYKGRLRPENQEAVVSGGVPVPTDEAARAQAHTLLGECLEARGQHAEALEHYLLGAKAGELGRAGNHRAAMKAALAYAYGRGVARDMVKAGEMLDLRAKLSNRHGSMMAASMVNSRRADTFAMGELEDEYSRRDADEGVRLHREIVETLLNRRLPGHSKKEARRWIEAAVAEGQPWAMTALACLELDAAGEQRAVQLFRQAAERGDDPVAWGNLGICLWRGIGEARDEAKAREIWTRHAQRSFLCADCLRGQVPARPVPADEVVRLCRRAARRDDPLGMYHYGLLRLTGQGIERDFNEGIDWVRRASDAGLPVAVNDYGIWQENQARRTGDMAMMARAATLYQKAAAAGEAAALCNLGVLYQQGASVARSEAKAEEAFRRCLELKPDHAIAINNLAFILQQRARILAGTGNAAQVASLREEMWRHFREADRLGNAFAAFNLGMSLRSGADGIKDIDQAYRHLDDAAQRGYAPGHAALGEMFERGEGVPQSYSEAAYHHRFAALAGNLASIARLSEYYLKGLGVARDLERAARWQELALSQGSASARVDLARIRIEQGAGAEALELLRVSSVQGEDSVRGAACHLLSQLYRGKAGVAADPVQAQLFHRMAVECRDPDALAEQGGVPLSGGKG